MSVADIAVIIAAVAALAGLGWFFFAPRRARTAELAGGVQRITVTVRGGYSPDVIRARQGIPLELVFDRQESGECTSRVVFPDLRVSAGLLAHARTTVRLNPAFAGFSSTVAGLPAHARTTVLLNPAKAGDFGFACGMNMIHGTLQVEPATGTET